MPVLSLFRTTARELSFMIHVGKLEYFYRIILVSLSLAKIHQINYLLISVRIFSGFLRGR